MLVMTERSGVMMFVQSSRPPMPTSTTATSTASCAKCLKANAVVSSKNEGRSGSKKGTFVLHESHDLFFRNHLSVDADALPEVREMGRGVEPHLVSCGLEDGRQRVAARALPVGAANVDGPVLAVRMPEVLIQRPCVVQPLFISRSSHVLEHGYAVEEIFRSLLVSHVRVSRLYSK